MWGYEACKFPIIVLGELLNFSGLVLQDLFSFFIDTAGQIGGGFSFIPQLKPADAVCHGIEKSGVLNSKKGKKKPLRRFMTETHIDFSLEISGS